GADASGDSTVGCAVRTFKRSGAHSAPYGHLRFTNVRSLSRPPKRPAGPIRRPRCILHRRRTPRGAFKRNSMDTILVTGGAGFIGCNFVRLALAEGGARVVVLDKLTYAGSLENLADVLADPRLEFVEGDIADRATVRRLFAEKHP